MKTAWKPGTLPETGRGRRRRARLAGAPALKVRIRYTGGGPGSYLMRRYGIA